MSHVAPIAPMHVRPEYAHSTYTILFLGLIVLWTQASIDNIKGADAIAAANANANASAGMESDDNVNISFVASAMEPGAMILIGLMLLFVLHFLVFPFIVNCFNPAIEYSMLRAYLPEILIAIKYFLMAVAIPLLVTCLTTACILFMLLKERLSMQTHVLPLFLVVGTVLFLIG
jgi:hypothetical protein